MKIVCDLHIHSKYSRATSKDLDLEGLDKWARLKGIQVMGTGDFTHPLWIKNLEEKLKPAEPGLYSLKGQSKDLKKTRFLLTTEISCIYKKNDKVRKNHILIFSPSLEIAKKISIELGKIGNIKSDGRPILGLDAKELLKIVLNISDECFIVPAHAWTPWFSVFGSKSGFDSLRDCFDDYSKYIYAIETGLSSDPAMNWRLSDLDNISFISNSDSHSLHKIGREANVFNTDISYKGIIEAIKSKDVKKFLYTIEFFPEEGKYHNDGHRICGITLAPEKTKKYGGICPVCGKPLVIGVLNRVDELADRPLGYKPKERVPFKSLIPLEEIIADAVGQNTGTKAVWREYYSILDKLGTELDILIDLDKNMILKATTEKIAEGILRVRNGDVGIEPGYDGVYGKIDIFGKERRDQKLQKINQKTLFE
jgi:uncharacterized protein (TIGR00375 family)